MMETCKLQSDELEKSETRLSPALNNTAECSRQIQIEGTIKNHEIPLSHTSFLPFQNLITTASALSSRQSVKLLKVEKACVPSQNQANNNRLPILKQINHLPCTATFVLRTQMKPLSSILIICSSFLCL